MLTIGMLILLAIGLGTVIALVALRINGDDGKPWPHDATSDEHRWED
jgi:hypothetical protein